MDFHSIDTFLAVVRTKTISGAAEELHLAQTTVSQRIKVIEKEIGVQLIERGKGIKQIILTPLGEEFYKLAKEWSRLGQEAKLLKTQGPQLPLIVGGVDSVNTFVLPKVFKKLSNHHPPIKLQIRTLHSDNLYSEVENRHIDVAYSLRKRVHPNVNVKKCFTSPMVVLQTSDISCYSSKKLHPKELDSDYELFMPWGVEYQSWHSYWWDPLSISRIKLDSTHLLLHLLQDPLQWAIVPKWIADEAIKRGSYKIYDLTDSPPDYTVYELTHIKQTTLKQKAIEIIDHYFQEEFS
ncbi:LysR family transcriptional regulator [Peribacillus frigoritolerans]|uniref:LysR family transcriptional regulator n=1 Tax=Peribacillus frigoritolerans TaxID=450367 RepID=UPI0035182148